MSHQGIHLIPNRADSIAPKTPAEIEKLEEQEKFGARCRRSCRTSGQDRAVLRPRPEYFHKVVDVSDKSPPEPLLWQPCSAVCSR
jgi:hypothetical protein